LIGSAECVRAMEFPHISPKKGAKSQEMVKNIQRIVARNKMSSNMLEEFKVN
jgi:hypothetical protein